MANKTADKIIEYIKNKKQVAAGELVDYLGISRQALFKHHLSKLLQNGVLVKTGKPPKVFYLLKEKKEVRPRYKIDKKLIKIINTNYLIITPGGEKLEGYKGFVYWCEKQELPVEKTAKEYALTLQKYARYKKSGLIGGMQKLKGTFSDVYLDKMYYLDFYSIERFGKTKLGQLLLYAKQSQNKKLMKELIDETRISAEKLIKKFKIGGAGFIPPTVKRETQFMNELKKKMRLTVKEIAITKIKTDIIVPQKTLNKLNDRIENAKKTFAVEETGNFNAILLIDDAVGSGATLNEIAKKIKDRGIAKKVIGLAITGSFKGFDVISEV
ncbi:MAG: hypothetical protein V1825_04605 [Candidatus Falkowbacteria bacterium]